MSAPSTIAARTTDPIELLRNAALRSDDLHAALFNKIADTGDVALFNYDCTTGCDGCGMHVEAWCEYCDAPLIESDEWREIENGPHWHCACFRAAVYAIAVAALTVAQ
jgi:hypothetical protein